MSLSFSELKKSRKDNFTKLTEKLNQMSNAGYQNDDDRFWQPTVDKAGNGYAVIRFLPAPAGEESPFVRIWDHGFKGPGGWYIENSLTTIEQPDPVSEMNTKLWTQGEGSEGRKIVQGVGETPGTKRRLQFKSNIYVVEDSAKPENVGKVFLYSYGKKIYDKIFEAANPKYPDKAPFDPFDLWEGANFKLKIRKVEGYRSYEDSEWDLVEGPEGKKVPRGPLLKDDKKLEEIWKAENSLQELLAPSKFKSYSELKAKLHRVLGMTKDDEPEQDVAPPWEEKSKPAPVVQASAAPETEAEIIEETVVSEEPSMDFFRKLAT